MESYDAEKAARVWQRVRPGSDGLHVERLQTLLLQTQQLSMTYRTLARQVKPPYYTALKQLSEQKQAQVDCLRGIYILAVGPCPTPNIPRPKSEPIIVALRRCFASETQLLTQLELLSAEPAHGPVFATLTEDQKAHCKAIIGLAGQLNR